MTETPDQRRERIDGARREQAELLRQIGHEHASIAVRPSAMEAWRILQVKVAKSAEDGTPVRCTGKADQYTDYDAFNVPSPGRAKMMCGIGPTACPALAECDLYAEVDKPGWGVYGGAVYGRDLADKERREYIKTETNKMKEERGEQ